jgi:hypothetical protein
MHHAETEEQIAAQWGSEVPGSVAHRLDAAVHIWAENVQGPLEVAGAWNTLSTFEKHMKWLQDGARELTGTAEVLQPFLAALNRSLEQDASGMDDEDFYNLSMLVRVWQIAAQDFWEVRLKKLHLNST